MDKILIADRKGGSFSSEIANRIEPDGTKGEEKRSQKKRERSIVLPLGSILDNADGKS